MTKLTYVVLIAALCAPAYAAEVNRPKVYSDIVACRALTDSAARLKCFDAAAMALETATENRQVVILDQSEVRKTKRSLFGFSLPKIPFFGESDEEQEEEFKEIEGELANVQALPYGKYQFTVKDAGTWQTTQGISSILRNGKKFKIKRAALGSFMLVMNNTGIRVKRVN
ncbi:hypothetical protein [Sphingorhabdus sp.]|uniref:hypothetical protein n=1 Tax=Sphingorhabdus sp. TaxID=1902408 RepID=UPI003983C973